VNTRLPSQKRILLGLALVLLFAAPGFSQGSETRPDCYVLSVGINQYRAADVPDLRGCVNDGRFTAQQFRNQDGKRFGRVEARLLLDREATKEAIAAEMASHAGMCKAGDWVVLFLSGHGHRRGGSWAFLPHDFESTNAAATSISDAHLLSWAGTLMAQGKTVVIIIDACFAGQVRHSARDLLTRRQEPGEGGLILMLSSMASQTSVDLGEYSAFARAVGEGLAGKADLNGDGTVTLGELRRYAYHRVHELLRDSPRQRRSEQDGECDFSLAIPDSLPLALTSGGDGIRPGERGEARLFSRTVDGRGERGR
jgi:hypothetical protein